MMVQPIERQHHVQAWALSVAVHSVGVTVVWILVSQMRPFPVQEIFQWNVSLVQPVQQHSIGSSVEAVPPPAPQLHTRRMPPAHIAPRSEIHGVHAQSTIPVVTALPQPPLESTKMLEQQLSQVMAPPTPVQQEPAIEQSPSTDNEMRTVQEAQTVEQRPEPVAPSTAALKESIALETSLEPAQPVNKEGQRVRATHADYGWLIESLGARLAELKQYPAAARSNEREGKVLLRAVIRADGQVVEIRVQKSSGSEELDAAALETMRQASPLHLRHELGRTQVAVTVPLVYTLAR